MAVDPAPATCGVVVLAARPDLTAVLVAASTTDASGAGLALPTVEVAVEPSIVDVVAAVADLVGRPVTLLRANTVEWDDATFDATAMVVEIEPLDGDLPDRLGWSSLDGPDLEGPDVEPAWARPSLVAWLDELREGWSELRPPWSRPGWGALAGAWMVDRMRQSGYGDPDPPHVHHLWGFSAVLAASAAGGTAYLKCSTGVFRHEAVLTQALAERSPGRLPDVLAVEPDEGWLLMRALPSPELGELPEVEWGAGLVALAELQHRWLGRGDELLSLGARPRPLDRLAEWVEATAGATELVDRLAPADRDAWLRAMPQLVDACARLDALGPGPSLVHGDFHPWNVSGSGDAARIFDWTDCAVSHPFIDLVTYVMRTKDEGVRPQLMDTYLERWSDVLTSADLAEAGRLALVVGALHQVQTYTLLVPTAMPADRGSLAGGDVQWMRRALSRLSAGISGPY